MNVRPHISHRTLRTYGHAAQQRLKPVDPFRMFDLQVDAFTLELPHARIECVQERGQPFNLCA